MVVVTVPVVELRDNMKFNRTCLWLCQSLQRLLGDGSGLIGLTYRMNKILDTVLGSEVYREIVVHLGT